MYCFMHVYKDMEEENKTINILHSIISIIPGDPHICQNLNQFGHGKGTIYGGCSQYTIVPARYAYLLQTDLSDSVAAILERESLINS